jgi:hypothetical protein
MLTFTKGKTGDVFLLAKECSAVVSASNFQRSGPSLSAPMDAGGVVIIHGMAKQPAGVVSDQEVALEPAMYHVCHATAESAGDADADFHMLGDVIVEVVCERGNCLTTNAAPTEPTVRIGLSGGSHSCAYLLSPGWYQCDDPMECIAFMKPIGPACGNDGIQMIARKMTYQAQQKIAAHGFQQNGGDGSGVLLTYGGGEAWPDDVVANMN